MKALQLSIDPSQSIETLIGLQKITSVQRSPHVGNFGPANIALAHAGIECVVVDHTIPSRDKNYFPGSLIVGGESIDIIDPKDVHKLTPFVAMSEVGRQACARFGIKADFAVDAHMSALQSAFPDTLIRTDSKYIQDNREVSEQLLAVLAYEGLLVSDRLVNRDGFVEKVGMREVALESIVNLKEPRSSGFLLSNAANIALNFAIESVRSEKDTIFHLSGPDMVVYIGDIMPEITKLYSCISRFGNLVLSETLNVNLVPTSFARLIVPITETRALNRTLELLGEVNGLSEDKAEAFRTKPKEVALPLALELEKASKAKKGEITEALSECMSIFPAKGKVESVTQYDVLDGKVYETVQNRAFTMEQLKGILVTLRKLAPKGDKTC